MLIRNNRLFKKTDFDRVFKEGESFKQDFLVLRIAPGKTESKRFGIIVSQKVSKSAVVRNKVKRRIRAVTKSLLPGIKKRADVILIALPGLETKKFKSVEETIKKLFKAAKLINNV